MRVTADQLGFSPSPDALEQCLDTATELGVAAQDIEADSDVATTNNPEISQSGSHRALLATYDEPRRERETGPLMDEQVAIKDNIAAAGLVMTCGSEHVGVVPDADATVVDRLLAAGAAVVGKANMDVFALGPSGEFSDYGPVENPVVEDRVPGGSSSGSGVAVAAGDVDIALGSDTGGSVRIPAACCGIVGHKSTHGYVPRHGFVSFAPSLDTIGPLARDVKTVARTLGVVAGADSRDSASNGRSPDDIGAALEPPVDITVGLPTEFFDATDDAVADAVRDAVNAAPVTVTSVDLPLGAVEEAYFLIGATEFVWYLDQNGTTRGQGSDYSAVVHSLVAAAKESDLGDHITRRLLPSAHLDAETAGETYRQARQEATAFSQRVAAVLADIDALVLPTIRTLPPERGQIDTTADMLDLLGNTAPFNLSRSPATAVPVGKVDGLPVSAQVVGPQFTDFETLAIAARLTGR